jgi:hypothetical protein
MGLDFSRAAESNQIEILTSCADRGEEVMQSAGAAENLIPAI